MVGLTNLSELSKEKQEQLKDLISAIRSMPEDVSELAEDAEFFDYTDEEFDNEEYEKDESNKSDYLFFGDEDEEVVYEDPIPDKFTQPRDKYTRSHEKRTKNKRNYETREDFYSKSKVIIGDKLINFDTPELEADWGEYLKENLSADDKLKNLDNLVNMVTRDVLKEFGGALRVREIVVSDSRLIINNVLFAPKLNYDSSTISKFPMDTWGYIRSGCIASFFDWSALDRMSNLSSLVFDDSSFVLTYVADCLGLGRKFGSSSLFRICTSLEELWIEEDLLTRGGKSTESGERVKNKIGRGVAVLNLLDGLNVNIYKGTEGVQNYMVSNLKTYAMNRGNKGVLQFTGGVVARTGLAVGAITVNTGTHLIGGTLKAIGKVFKDAMTPYNGEE